MTNENLINQISFIRTFDLDTVEIILSEITRANILWAEKYNDYQSGGWLTAALYNVSGDPNDVVIRDGTGIPTTTLTQQMPFTQKFIDRLELKIMYVRAARLSVNSFLWEHVDYIELNQEKRYRLHIPLVTNSSALFVIAGQTLTLEPGFLWLFEPVKPHGVCNLYGPDRIHLIIDCYQNDSLDDLIAQRQLSDIPVSQLPPLEEPVLSKTINASNKLLELGFSRTAEHNLLQLFFRYAMPAGMPYDLIADLYKTHDRKSEALHWENIKMTHLKVRQ